MFATPTPPTVVVVEEVDIEKQVSPSVSPVSAPYTPVADEKSSDKKKKEDGVVVTVLSVGDANYDSPYVTPHTSVLELNGGVETIVRLDEKKSANPDGDSDADDEEEFPEGGLRAWLVVFGAWCGMFGCMG